MNTVVNPVVVAIADKQPSALQFAADEARMLSAPLRVIHSAVLPAQAVEFYVGVDAAMVDDIRAAGQAVVDEARAFLEDRASDVDVHYVLSSRGPLDVLRAEAAHARMIVLGVDDVPWTERLLRTKISGYLAKRAPCPVVIVPELEFPRGTAGEVVVTLDENADGAGPLRMAFDEANARDCLLHVLHSTPPGTVPADVAAARAKHAAILATWRARYPDVAVLEGYPTDDAAASLTRASSSADLVIIGRPRGHDVPLPWSRPLAAQVLRKAQCPIAVVPADYRGGPGDA